MTNDAENSAVTGSTPSSPEEVSIIDAPTPDAAASFLAETSAHSRSTRHWWIIAGVVAAVVAAAALVWVLWPSPASDADDAGSSGSPSGNSPAAVSTVTPTTPATSAQSPSSALSSAPARAGGSSGAKPVSPGASPAAPGAAPTVVVPTGKPLAEVAAPPERTIGMLVVPKGFTVAAYTVTFQPYGWGPGGQESGRLLAKIISSKPINASAAKLAKDFAGRNASMWVPPQIAKTIAVGGSYKGTLQVKPQGDVGVLYLVSAQPVK